MEGALDAAVRTVQARHRERTSKRSGLRVSSAPNPVREATALSTELQLMVAWGILTASAASLLARKQKEDYELLGVTVPKEISQMAVVGKSGEITSHVRRDFFKKFKPLSWLPNTLPSEGCHERQTRGSCTLSILCSCSCADGQRAIRRVVPSRQRCLQ